MNYYDTDNNKFLNINDKILSTHLIRSEILKLTFKFFSLENFIIIDPPILHEQILGKKYEIYLPHFNNEYSLNSSNALYMGAYSSIFGKVCAISHTFRDEQNSINHLREFTMIEAEMIGLNYESTMCFVEKFICYILANILECEVIKNNDAFFSRVTELLKNFHPARIPYVDFMDKLQQLESFNSDYNVDLSAIDYLVSKHISAPVFITEYPFGTWTSKRNFCDNKFLAFNLILPETYGELCEGCERTNDVEFLENKLQCANIKNLNWYIKAIGMIQDNRSGFGIGLDRLVRWIAGVERIQDTLIFSR